MMKKSLLLCLSALLLVVTGCKKDVESVESVTVIPENISLLVDESHLLSAVVKPEKAPQYVRWESSDTKVATVAPNGLVTAIAVGECEISVYADVQKAVCRVKVTAGSNPADTTQPQNGVLTFTVNGVAFKMLKVDGGTFQMGATAEQGDDVSNDEKPVHNVTLSTYHIGETEVTQALWKAVMASEPTENGGWTDGEGKGDAYPAYNVSWEDCQVFLDSLNRKLSAQLKGKKFALPTEAQWEYAARGGKRSKGYKYAGGNTLGDVAWYKDNSGYKAHVVKGKQPNELGLYDMSGNVYEWCSDWYEKTYYSSDAQTDPQGPGSGDNRVNRGGGWSGNASGCRVSIRNGFTPSSRYYSLGFRLVLVP